MTMLHFFFMALLAHLCALSAAQTPSYSSATPADIFATPTKRWLSVQTTGSGAQYGPWPPYGDGGPRMLRYCYENEDASTLLHDIVVQAIPMWTDATISGASALTIIQDPRCPDPDNEDCMCYDIGDNDGVVDALVISWGGSPDECSTVTTVGYDYQDMDTTERHTLKYCDYEQSMEDDPNEVARWNLVMAHEFGESEESGALGLERC